MCTCRVSADVHRGGIFFEWLQAFLCMRMWVHAFTTLILKVREATASLESVCLWYGKCVYMCDIYHHLQSSVWKAWLRVTVLGVLCSHVQASAALTRSGCGWAFIKINWRFLAQQGQEFLSSFAHLRVSLAQSHLSSRVTLSACLSEPDWWKELT